MSNETRPRLPHWAEVMLALLGGLSALIAVSQFLWQTLAPALRSQKPAAAVTSAAATPGLGVLDASLSMATRHNHILGLIPSGSVTYYLLDVTVANPQAKARNNCALVVEYALSGGGHGSGVAFHGGGPGWGGKAGATDFSLPAQPALQTQFYLPSDNGDTPLTSARVRVGCSAPDNQTSAWHSVAMPVGSTS